MRKFNVTVNGVSYEVEVEEVGAAQGTAPVAAAPVAAAPVAAAPKAAAPKAAAPVAGTKLTSPMPGNILDVKCKVGDAVKKGDVLVVLEAMKMENELKAADNATVKQVLVQKGATVNSGDVLVVLG